MLDSGLIEGCLNLHTTKIQSDEKPRKVGAGETANKANIKLLAYELPKQCKPCFLRLVQKLVCNAV